MMLKRKQRQLIAAIVFFVVLAVTSVGFYMLPLEVGPGTGGLGLLYGIGGTILIVLDCFAIIFFLGSLVEAVFNWIDQGPK